MLYFLVIFNFYCFFLGIYFAVAAGFGPASGYVIGGATLQIFTDLSNR